MTDEDALLAAIIAAPDDDLPRMVYADYLDDHNTPEAADRAAFIRLQCKLATFGPRPACDCQGSSWHRPCAADPWDEQTATIRKRVADLLEPNFIAWSWGELPADFAPGTFAWSFRRGFADDVIADSESWLRLADRFTAAHPVTRVRLTTVPEAHLEWGAPGFPRGPLRWYLANGTVNLFPGIWSEKDERRDGVLELLSLRWPGIAFELPAEERPTTFLGIPIYAEPTLPQARRLVEHLTERRIDEERAVLMLRGAERHLPFLTVSWAENAIRAAFHLVRVMDGDPTIATPVGILYADDDSAAAPIPRRPRRPDFSDRGWQPRFPRPR